jgi:hypothetical protein
VTDSNWSHFELLITFQEIFVETLAWDYYILYDYFSPQNFCFSLIVSPWKAFSFSFLDEFFLP